MSNPHAMRAVGAFAALACVAAAMQLDAQDRVPSPPPDPTPQVMQQVTGYRQDYIPPKRPQAGDGRHLSPSDRYDAGRAHVLIPPPEHTVRVYIRYPRSYGYRDVDGAMQPTTAACAVFTVGVRLDTGTRQDQRFPGHPVGGPSTVGDDVLCAFHVDGVPFDVPVVAWAAMADARVLPYAPWHGGTQAQPPSGQRRVVQDAQRSLILTTSAPSARFDARMAYQ